jgi:hypothetical protein
MPAASIQEVLDQLDVIVADARRERSRLGYFAALYRSVTAEVQRGIATGRFADGARMERLDVAFANRYLGALADWRAGRPTSRCWRRAFDAASRWPPVILQHLLLGMNAHINLDLAIAAAETAPGGDIHALRGDFDEINRILVAMIDDVQHRIAAVSPWMWVLDRVGERTDEALCGYCIRRARDVAWENALRLAPLATADRADEVRRSDLLVAALALPLERPGPLARTALLCARVRETRDVGRVLDVLAS